MNSNLHKLYNSFGNLRKSLKANGPNPVAAQLNRTGAVGLYSGACSPRPCGPCRMAAQWQGRSARAHARRAQRTLDSDAGSGCTGSEDRCPMARYQLVDNNAREKMARASPALGSELGGGGAVVAADSGTLRFRRVLCMGREEDELPAWATQ
jgi:hypothetical protein